MTPWVLLDRAEVPGGGELRLMQRGAEFSIMLGANELMNSRLSGSEEALATLSCRRLRGRHAPRILIGGLGMGFTLRAALAELGPDASVVVAELAPAVGREGYRPRRCLRLPHLFRTGAPRPKAMARRSVGRGERAAAARGPVTGGSSVRAG